MHAAYLIKILVKYYPLGIIFFKMQYLNYQKYIGTDLPLSAKDFHFNLFYRIVTNFFDFLELCRYSRFEYA